MNKLQFAQVTTEHTKQGCCPFSQRSIYPLQRLRFASQTNILLCLSSNQHLQGLVPNASSLITWFRSCLSVFDPGHSYLQSCPAAKVCPVLMLKNSSENAFLKDFNSFQQFPVFLLAFFPPSTSAFSISLLFFHATLIKLSELLKFSIK